jgi:hypothetical protein
LVVRDTAKNKYTEAAGADESAEGGHADTDHGGGAHSRKDGGQRQLELDGPEKLSPAHAHAARGFDDGGRNAGETDEGVANDGSRA